MGKTGTMSLADIRSVLKSSFPGFTFSFLGTGFILVWIQCILYARYIWVDSGLTTVAINFTRCICIVALAAIVVRGLFTPRFQRIFGWVSIGLMTAGSLLFFVESLDSTLPFTSIAAICSGIGLAWGGGMWINFYIRLGFKQALIVAFASLALSTVIGIPIALVSENTAFFVSILLPMVTFAMYRQAHRSLNALEAKGSIRAVPVDDVYASEPRSTIVRIGMGIALFSFVLGVSRGFPYGASIELPVGYQIAQFVGVTVVALGVVWWSVVRGRRLRFSAFWQMQIAALAAGVILLSTLDQTATHVGATLIAVTNLFQVGFLWFVSYDVARHRAIEPCLVVGFFWLLHLFFRESGRLAMWMAGGAESTAQMLIIAVMVCFLAVSVGFLLADSIPRVRQLFAEEQDERCEPVASRDSDAPRLAGARGASFGREVASCDRVANSFGFSSGSTDGDASGVLADRASDNGPLVFDELHRSYHLTRREFDVLELIAEGRSSSYIARRLVLSEHTVRGYVKSIYQKLGLHSKQEAIDFMKERFRSDS